MLMPVCGCRPCSRVVYLVDGINCHSGAGEISVEVENVITVDLRVVSHGSRVWHRVLRIPIPAIAGHGSSRTALLLSQHAWKW